jgi:hypothetical protein
MDEKRKDLRNCEIVMNYNCIILDFTGHQLLLDINNQPTISLWEINAAIRIKINCATYVNVKEAGKV